jgi:hypothetical protein
MKKRFLLLIDYYLSSLLQQLVAAPPLDAEEPVPRTHRNPQLVVV